MAFFHKKCLIFSMRFCDVRWTLGKLKNMCVFEMKKFMKKAYVRNSKRAGSQPLRKRMFETYIRNSNSLVKRSEAIHVLCHLWWRGPRRCSNPFISQCMPKPQGRRESLAVVSHVFLNIWTLRIHHVAAREGASSGEHSRRERRAGWLEGRVGIRLRPPNPPIFVTIQ